MKPMVGITAGFDPEGLRLALHRSYFQAVAAAGGVPWVVPPLPPGDAPAVAELVQGLMLAGGPDLDPVFFGEEPRGTRAICPERDRFELELVGEVRRRGKPVLAICRGLQVLNVAAGGDLHQDLGAAYPEALKHEQDAPEWYATHRVRLMPGSRLARIFGRTELRVNSFHHQAVRRVAPGFRVCAWSDDGIVEAIEAPGSGFVIGVQWHPERMWERDEHQFGLFRAFVAACVEAAENR